LDKLPDYLDEEQRKKRIENILQQMKRNTIKNIGTRTNPKWVRK